VFDGVLATDAEGQVCADRMQPELAVNLHGRGPRSHRALLHMHPGSLLAYAHPEIPESSGGPSWTEHEHEASRWARLLHSAGIACDPAALDIEHPVGPCRAPRGCTVIDPGADRAAQRWPVERWAAVARDELHGGHRVFVIGSSAERALVLELARRAGLDVARSTAVGHSAYELARIIDRAGLVLCGDTGVGHLATALRRPSVTLFGPTSPARSGPPLHRPWHRVLWARSEGDPDAMEPDAGLLQISVIDVEKEIAALRRALRLSACEVGSWPLFSPGPSALSPR
jgi:hypothetical protein